jgi:hypothetical protein
MTESQPDRRRWFALGVIVAAQFMVVLDVAIVTSRFPRLRQTSASARRTGNGW